MEELLSNREIATLVWIAVFAAWASKHKGVRSSFQLLLKTAFSRILLVFYAAMLSYIGLMLILLAEIGLWDSSRAKLALVWTLSVALIALLRANTIHEDEHYFRKAIRDNLNLIVILEFVVGFYSFSLIAELIIVPVVTMVVLVHAFSEGKEEYKPVEKLLTGILTSFGFAVLSYAMYKVFDEFKDFATLNTLQDFYLPLLLSTLFLPFLFLVTVYLSYERAFGVFKRKGRSRDLEQYARFKALKYCKFSVRKIERLTQVARMESWETEKAIDASISTLSDRLEIEANPPAVADELGWSPYEAKEYLTEYDLNTGHYNNIGGNEWFCSTPPVDIGEGDWPNALSYFVSGDDHAAKSLKLRLYVNSPDYQTQAEEHFIVVAETLISKAIQMGASTNLREVIDSAESTTSDICGRVICFTQEEPLKGKGVRTLTLEIRVADEAKAVG